MAKIVLGIGTSHTPQMTMDPSLWEDHAGRDVLNAGLVAYDGEIHPFAELADRAAGRFGSELALDVYWAKHQRAQAALSTLCAALASARPDVVIVVGDDQNELFGAHGVPAIGLYTGETVDDLPRSPESLARLSEGMRQAAWASHSATRYTHVVDAEMATHLLGCLTEENFDLTQVRAQGPGQSIGHAFNFVRYRLGLDPKIPIVPVLLNTYIPPNVLGPGRCYRLGQAIARAVASYREDQRVVIVGSGGLSHFVVLEEFDRGVLSALRSRDDATIAALPRRYFRSGTSEVLNWIVAGGALESLAMEVVDYVPGFRSPAGTGTGMGFALWR